MMLVKYNLLITFSRKKKLASRKDKNGCGHKVGQPEITPMGPPCIVQGDYTGFNTGNREKLSYSQAAGLRQVH